jgi:DNA replication protein DnaC
MTFSAQECAEDIVGRVVDGYNATLMAYGQTGSGKTYTMTGAEMELCYARGGLYERANVGSYMRTLEGLLLTASVLDDRTTRL